MPRTGDGHRPDAPLLLQPGHCFQVATPAHMSGPASVAESSAGKRASAVVGAIM